MMNSVKPAVDQDSILSLLSEHFHQPILDLSPVRGGLIAQTLSFRAGDDEFILRFTTDKIEASYQKEAYIYNHFSPFGIPIPPVLKVGSTGELNYCISRKMPGVGLEFLSREEYEQALPEVIQTLYIIHQVNVQGREGFGWLDDRGKGMFPTWKSFLVRIIEEERAGGFYGKWHSLFENTFLERDFFETVYKKMLQMLSLCPEDRYFVHGGYGYNNVLAREGKVTAVLDWVDTKYGDFLYDIAWIDFWPRFRIDHAQRFHQYYVDKGMPLPNYWERIACYKLYMGMDGMRFFAKTNDRDAYQAVCKKLSALL